METAGKILKKKREEKGLTLEQVACKIKIKKKFLQFLEEDHFENLPSETYARGFVKNYAEFLGLSSPKVLAIFRRQFRGVRNQRFSVIKKNGGDSFFKITPQRIRWGLILILILTLFVYLLKQYRSLTSPPSLVLFEPTKDLLTHQEKILVKGKTESDALVFINNKEVFPDKNGEFSQEVLLSPGVNEIVILVENALRKRKKIVREVTFKPL